MARNNEQIASLHERLDELAQSLEATRQLPALSEARLSELTEKPTIDVRIKEAFIIPKKDRVAECFVRLSLQNDTAIDCKPTDYSVTLRIKGADYSHTSPLALNDYRLCYGKVQSVYDNELDTTCEIWATVTSEELSTMTNDLGCATRGDPLEGWIAVAVHNVPEWESAVESIGTYVHAECDDEGNVIEEYPVDICEKVLRLTGVESLRVVVEDGFRQKWNTETTGPFESQTKRIRPRRVEDRTNDIFTQSRK